MAQRQFRSDDTSNWLYGFGNGSGGAYSSAGNATDAPIDASCSGTATQATLSASNVSFASGQLILIHQTRGTGVGNWELNRIESYNTGTITLSHALINTYTDSGASQAQVIVMPQYSSFTQNSGHTLTAKAWTGDVGGIVAFFCSGTTTVTGSLTALGKGRAGGAGNSSGGTGVQGEGTSGTGSANTAQNSGGGGGGLNGNGGGGGYITGGVGITGDGGTGNAGSAPGAGSLVTQCYLGSGGGGGGHSTQGTNGGIGGGLFFIFTKDLVVTGTLNDNGGNSANSTYRAGGAGSGGGVLIKCQTATLGTNLITSSGGTGGTSEGGNRGGAGSVGRIHMDYKTSYTGTTTPTIDVTQDTTLNDVSSSNMFFALL
jgi:hypothetical protein